MENKKTYNRKEAIGILQSVCSGFVSHKKIIDAINSSKREEFSTSYLISLSKILTKDVPRTSTR